MAWRLRRSLIVTLLVPLFLLVAPGAAGAGDLMTPVRIEIHPHAREAAIGGKIEYVVSLRNAMGKAVAAPKEMTIDVHATLPSGQVETRQVTIAQGAKDGSGAVPVSEAGAIPIGATNPELIGGGAVVFGKPGGGVTRGIALPIQATAAISVSEGVAAAMERPPAEAGSVVTARPEPGVQQELAIELNIGMQPLQEMEPADGEPGAARDPEAASRAVMSAPAISETPAPAAAGAEALVSLPARSGVEAAVSAPADPPLPAVAMGSPVPAVPAAPAADRAAEGTAEPAVEVVASLPPPSAAEEDRTLMLYVPETEILADGQMGTDVTVYLDPCAGMSEDVVVRLAVTKGHLDPSIVTIPRGECSASTRWRSDRMSMGDATLSVLVSVPRLQAGDKIVRSFVPPIHSLRLTLNPAEISLLNRGDVLAELHDDVNDVPVATDRPMKLTLALREGNGALRPLELVFDKGDSTTRASFQPTFWGKVVVAGQIPFRLEERAEFNVTSGGWIFLFSVIGGLIGGFLAYRAKKEKPVRILIGLVTGFALFAFFLFFGAENILEATGGLNVLNPVSVVLLSLVGGWAGTKVLAWALAQIGIEA